MQETEYEDDPSNEGAPQQPFSPRKFSEPELMLRVLTNVDVFDLSMFLLFEEIKFFFRGRSPSPSSF